MTTLYSSNLILSLSSATRSFSGDRVEVNVYNPLGNGVFIASDIPARIPSSDLLTIVSDDCCQVPGEGMFEVSRKTFEEYIKLSSRTQKSHEMLWTAWKAKLR
jgi:hypothetical protein